MRIVIDLDGTICQLKKPDQSYAEVLPLPGAQQAIRSLKKQGHEIVIYTARNMKTQGGNVGRVMQHVGKTTIDWLVEYDIPYDELVFGKPYGDLYIDDLACTFHTWQEVMRKLAPEEKEE
ncbi:capsular biosynthesis protein [Xylanibacillus composti]|uniref:Capsular biosynthesis protein n=1 Tax=Xylanibacillus composti TaxID=1572762 RepID=A0A8J4H5R3_9BACL|nr:HAD hydrolase family protein [Xylanibacillus composti]MDT9726714.1 capsular biosynthesis protein [Xylanibacillus composti]GIQ69354.1 hypothetical protein XYCOK13_21780 [Xylanibacillus composti]